MGKFLIDSVILIDHLNGVDKASKWLSRNRDSYISVITRAEILAGASPEEAHTIKLLLDSFKCLAITNNVADKAAELRQQYNLKLPDAFQAALAILNDIQLATRDAKDFKPGIEFVKIPYKL